MKNRMSVFLLTMSILVVLGSCMSNGIQGLSSPSTQGSEQSIIEKLYEIGPEWTQQQVHDFLGLPDEQGEASVVPIEYYQINQTTRATIYYWSDGIKIKLINAQTKEITNIL